MAGTFVSVVQASCALCYHNIIIRIIIVIGIIYILALLFIIWILALLLLLSWLHPLPAPPLACAINSNACGEVNMRGKLDGGY
jgi:hypothetical protein